MRFRLIRSWHEHQKFGLPIKAAKQDAITVTELLQICRFHNGDNFDFLWSCLIVQTFRLALFKNKTLFGKWVEVYFITIHNNFSKNSTLKYFNFLCYIIYYLLLFK